MKRRVWIAWMALGCAAAAACSDANVAGDYNAPTNGHPDCGSRESGLTVQDFNATRPPVAE